MMTVERDFTSLENDLAMAGQAVRNARLALNKEIRERSGGDAIYRDIDQFTAREACTVLAALRLVQTIQLQGGALPAEIRSSFNTSRKGPEARLTDMEHFETEAPLGVEELEDLCERIDVDFNRE
jgi:hypothetical protein